MEKITNKEQTQEEKNLEIKNKENINLNKKASNINIIKSEKNKDLDDNSNQNQVKLNLNSKYDNALLEELNNSKTKSWRMDIINATQEEEKDNNSKNYKNKSNNNNQKAKEEIDKEDRFKDFDEILFIEENRDKKRKNRSIEKIIFSEKIAKIPKPSEKRKNANDKNNKLLIQENNNLNKNSSTLSELNKFIENCENITEEIENKKNGNKGNNKNKIINNQEKSSNLSEVINNTIENNDNNYKNINLEYSDDKRSHKERDDNKIKNNLELIEKIKNEKKSIDYIYNNFIDLYDKKNENDKKANNLNRKLFGKNNIKMQNVVNNKSNPQLKVSKSCNIMKNYRSINAIKDNNNFIYPNKSQNIKKSLICDKNTINIQLSIKRKTRSAKDIRKHMSYYIMEENINSPKEINSLNQFMYKYPSKRNYNSNGLNSFLSLYITPNQINSKNQIKYIATPFNIFKNSFQDKIKKKINKINSNKNFRINRETAKNNYINLEFFEESKQDNFFGKTSRDSYVTKNKIFEIHSRKNNEENFFRAQNNFYNEINKINNIKENNNFFQNNIGQKKDNINNYLFKTYSTNLNHNRIFSFQSNENKNLDYFKEKNEIFGRKFDYNSNHVKNLEFESYHYSNNIFNTTKNILYPKMKMSKSYNSIFQNRLNNDNKERYSYLCNNNNYKNINYNGNLTKRQTNIFSSNFYI